MNTKAVRLNSEKRKSKNKINGEREGAEKKILAGDEADEFGDAFLDGVLGVLGDLAVLRQSLLHDATDVGDGQIPVLLAHAAPAAAASLRALLAAAFMATARRARRCLRHYHNRSLHFIKQFIFILLLA